MTQNFPLVWCLVSLRATHTVCMMEASFARPGGSEDVAVVSAATSSEPPGAYFSFNTVLLWPPSLELVWGRRVPSTTRRPKH